MATSGQGKVELHCPACGRDSWLVRKAEYDGFTKTGDSLSCALCGHRFASEADIPFKKGHRPRVFTEADKPCPVHLFAEEERGRMCRYCREYVVNPFLQRCGLHRCEVEATDTCPRFEPKKTSSADGGEGVTPLGPLG
ncbi:MAG: hypothetical protein LBN38_07380 [Verrucomicrobiota bacterium]|nr:hypothetical protein [Verrucomicrobiota bacterium]